MHILPYQLTYINSFGNPVDMQNGNVARLVTKSLYNHIKNVKDCMLL
jgi:hypothetical protein